MIKPDLTFFIDANAETIQSRSDYGSERYERVEFQKKVSEAYTKFRSEAAADEHWVTIQANERSIDSIHQDILERVIKYMDEDVAKYDLDKIKHALFTTTE